MAITSAEIHNQSFSIDRKGYDVDEVDVFLEHVADEIDGLNQLIESLRVQLDDNAFAGFDTPVNFDEEPGEEAAPAEETQIMPAVNPAELEEKDARIAELEAQLESKKADDNAIAQALIIAQRSADEILSNAKADAAATVKDAEDEASRILDKAEADRLKVQEAIKKLEDDREDAREEYRDLLTDYINDANRKLAEIGEKTPSFARSAHARTNSSAVTSEFEAAPAPMTIDGSDAYGSSVFASALVDSSSSTTSSAVAAAPKPAGFEKDLSGFGDAADDFEVDDLD